ncbi:hypothetical protein BX070DRAFT_222316 [Coemansia spiralis]|nr:hypothetical protein BX070DRAFT_222316 [Coemansia spiralis]
MGGLFCFVQALRKGLASTDQRKNNTACLGAAGSLLSICLDIQVQKHYKRRDSQQLHRANKIPHSFCCFIRLPLQPQLLSCTLAHPHLHSHSLPKLHSTTMKTVAAVATLVSAVLAFEAGYEARAPEYHAPAYEAPKPEYHAPVHEAPKVYEAPKPEYHAPVPEYHAPVPEYHAPAPILAPKVEYHAPAPILAPVPAYHAPAYVAPKIEYHAPAFVAPKVEYRAPAPAYIAPAPIPAPIPVPVHNAYAAVAPHY